MPSLDLRDSEGREAMSWRRESPWDAIVIGGGPAGSAAAHALARAERQVLLIEGRAQVEFKLGELLPPLATPLLARLGLDKKQLTAEHAVARGTVSVWGSARPQTRDFLFNPYGDGLRLDRPAFDARLRRAAGEAGAVLAQGVRFVEAQRGELWRVGLSQQGVPIQQEARVLVDCSGRAGVLARQLGVERETLDQLVACGARYSSEGEENDPFLRIEACRSGWLYGLQLPSSERLVVFHTDADLLNSGDTKPAQALESALGESEHIGPRLREHGYRLSGRPKGAIARGARSSAVCGPGWFAAGDAALSFDPLSSQGIHHALSSGFRAADCILDSDDGDEQAAERYRAACDEVMAEYERQHAHYYAQESRWSGEAFWARRRG